MTFPGCLDDDASEAWKNEVERSNLPQFVEENSESWRAGVRLTDMASQIILPKSDVWVRRSRYGFKPDFKVMAYRSICRQYGIHIPTWTREVKTFEEVVCFGEICECDWFPRGDLSPEICEEDYFVFMGIPHESTRGENFAFTLFVGEEILPRMFKIHS
ncbi:MAG: hypothetical protein HYZ63_00485 [Candidatus Andersenbacteria bacterium]|nr:hypothetical protein [Candidatus Andersenbacteria bacterium]